MAKGDKAPSVLAFERKLNPSDAQLFSGDWKNRTSCDWRPITIREKSVRGTISNRLKASDNDATKINAKVENPNLQTVDIAALADNHDCLKMVFTLRVLGNVGVPSACNDRNFQGDLKKIVSGYRDTVSFSELAKRYALNLANGRFLWRNRVGAEHVEVSVEHISTSGETKVWTFDALTIPLSHFDDTAALKQVQNLASILEHALSNVDTHLLLRVTTYVHLGAGQEVFPSQELLLDSSSRKSKTLYAVDEIAGIHSQKIGNALRTIDTWHPEVESVGPIAVEPYGAVTSLGLACRPPGRGAVDFYTLLDNWVLRGEKPSVEHQHFTIAIIIRGGVFSQSGKD